MMHLDLSADEVLTTTRSVRKRLDFDKPVERSVILEALEIALQAPTGSNSQGWQWMFIDDQPKKDAIAALYKQNFDAVYAAGGNPYAEDDPRFAQQARVKSSADYLAENFAKAPVLMIPLIQGRLGPDSVQHAPGFWGSLLPAVWSFMLALRERGLGSAWTTLHLAHEREVADLLGVPYERYSQGGLFPIAYTVGTDFKAAKRRPAESLTHWNEW